MVQLDRNT